MRETMPMTFTANLNDISSYHAKKGVSGTLNMLRQDDAIEAGFWRASPEDMDGPFEATFDRNEVILIIEGHLRVEIVGEKTYDLRKGDSASFVKGAVGRWTIIEPVVEFFIYA